MTSVLSRDHILGKREASLDIFHRVVPPELNAVAQEAHPAHTTKAMNDKWGIK